MPSRRPRAGHVPHIGFGLRPRLFAALALTSVVTLGVAALALLPPLNSRLRNDTERFTEAAVNTARPYFAAIALNNGRPPNALIARADANRLQHDRVLIWAATPTPHPISDTDRDGRYKDTLAIVARALSAKGPGLTPHAEIGGVFVVASLYRDGGRRFVLEVLRSLDYVGQSAAVVQTAFLDAAIAGLIVALLLGAVLSSRLLSRLRLLRDATLNLDDPGLAGLAVAEDAVHDEIGQLARAFAAMRERLRAQENARRSFVATASHELRTPLTSLDGMLELIADDLSSDPIDLDDARERVALAHEQSRRLAGLASDLLDLSRLDAALELRAEPVELGEIARAVSAEFERLAQQRGVELAIVSAAQPCWTEADPGSVARIVRILLDNALRVAPPDSTVTIKIGSAEDPATLEVADQGPGVPVAERARIFERFQRGSVRSGDGGFGLGLAIGRELATRMGGSLVLDGRGAGARFRLRLPPQPAGGHDE